MGKARFDFLAAGRYNWHIPSRFSSLAWCILCHYGYEEDASLTANVHCTLTKMRFGKFKNKTLYTINLKMDGARLSVDGCSPIEALRALDGQLYEFWERDTKREQWEKEAGV